jgi:hypothetical protein
LRMNLLLHEQRNIIQTCKILSVIGILLVQREDGCVVWHGY